MSVVLKASNVVKKFPGVIALNGCRLDLQKGEVHALLGENGAGKSTMSKVLSGIYKFDSGELLIDNKEVSINSVEDAEFNGISIIHQEIVLIPEMRIFENIFLGKELKHIFNITNDKCMIEKADEFLSAFNFNISSQTKLGKLSIAQQQMVEIIKAMSFHSRIVFMDEPTSSLTEKETHALFAVIKRLTDQGVSIVYISHKLDEIFAITDRITVMRDGKTIGTVQTKDTNKNELVSMMVGRELTNYYKRTYNDLEKSPVALEVKNIFGPPYIKDVSFSLKKGEILGFAGLIGAGRSELMKIIFAIEKKQSGKIFLDGKLLEASSVAQVMDAGIALIPENRKEEGLILENTVGYNMTLCILSQFMKFFAVNKKQESSIIDEYIASMSIKTKSKNQFIKFLSGGNQQKVVLAKWLAIKPKVLILDEPTRGVDVGAKSEIYEIIDSLAKSGVAIIIISSELTEVIEMSDRIIVMHEGLIKGQLNKADFSQEKIMYLAT